MSEDQQRPTWRQVREDALARNPQLRAQYERDIALHTFVSAMIAARSSRGWTQAQLAEAAGTTQPVIARLERAQRDPRLSTMVAVCQALELPLMIGTSEQRLAG